MPFVQAGEHLWAGQVADVGQRLGWIVGHVQVIAHEVGGAQFQAQRPLEHRGIAAAAVAAAQDQDPHRRARQERYDRLGELGAVSLGIQAQDVGGSQVLLALLDNVVRAPQRGSQCSRRGARLDQREGQRQCRPGGWRPRAAHADRPVQ
jgi:hypothetical protein